MFLCHERTGRICAGWVGCHDTHNLLALRLAAAGMRPEDLQATFEYVSPIPLASSGREAADHGLRDLDNPGAQARIAAAQLAARIARHRPDGPDDPGRPDGRDQ